MREFPCSGCGACCRRVADAVRLIGIHPEGHPLHFPYQWDESGRCLMLTEDNRCSVYENRPIICDIKRYATLMGIELEDFYRQNISACNSLMESEGLPLSLRIIEL